MRQTKAEVYLHLVWATRYREPRIAPEWEHVLYRCMEGEARRLKCDVLAIGGTEDHVHVLIHLPTTVTVARLAQQLKGVSSKFVQDQLAGGENFYWQSGYGVFSVGRSQTERVMAYINNQKKHHAEAQIHPRWEVPEQINIPSERTVGSLSAPETGISMPERTGEQQ